MSNYLSIRRVKFQEIDSNGNEIGKPTYGVLASDDYAQAYTDIYETHEELESEIRNKGSIIELVDSDGIFDGVDKQVVGINNFFGLFPKF